MTQPNWYKVEVYQPTTKRGRSRGVWRQVAYVRTLSHVMKVKDMVAPLRIRRTIAEPIKNEIWPNLAKFNQDNQPIYDAISPNELPNYRGVDRVDMLWLAKRKAKKNLPSIAGSFPAVVITIDNEFPDVIRGDKDLEDRFFRLQAERLCDYLYRALPDRTIDEFKKILCKDDK